MKLQINRAKPFIYIIIALIGFYIVFSLRQQATAQSDANQTQRINNSGRHSNRQRQNPQTEANRNQGRAAETDSSRNEAGQESQTRENAAGRQSPQTTNTAQAGDNFRQRYDAAGTSERDRINRQSPNFGFFQITFILIILGIIGYFAYKYVSKRKTAQMEAAEYISVLATSPLTANKHLQVVQIFDNIYILGIGDNSISLIKEVTDKNLINQIRDEAKNRLPSLTFKEQLLKFVNKLKPGGSIKKDPEEEALSFFKEQREKLNNLNGKNKEK